MTVKNCDLTGLHVHPVLPLSASRLRLAARRRSTPVVYLYMVIQQLVWMERRTPTIEVKYVNVETGPRVEALCNQGNG